MRKKLKIGYLLSYFHPFKDGTENNCLYLARAMVNLGHEVHVFTSDRRDGTILEEKEIMYEGIHIHRSPTWARYKYYLELNPGIVPMVLKHKDLDILHVHSFGFMMYDAILMLKNLMGHKTVIINTPHGPFMSLDSYPAWQKALKTIFKTVEYPINRMYDAVIQVNTTQFPWIKKSGIKRKNIHFVPDGIPDDRYREIDNKDFIKKHGLEGKFVICNLGRILEYKGQDQVIQALPDIIKKHPNVVFLQMGKDHGWKEHCITLATKLGIQDHVKFLGMVSEDDKLRGLDVADIFIIPSEWEAFGIVTLEAMARRTAAIGTTCEGSIYLIREDNGILYDWKDIPAMKTALLKLIEDSNLRNKMANANYKKAQGLRNVTIAKEYLEPLYYKLWIEKRKTRQ
jgi:glycosyltransferase involved in cell wall biosynthesis